MTKQLMSMVAVCAVAVGCSSLPPERQLVADAVAAIGGEARLAAVKTLRVEGGGTAYQLGQNLTPTSDLTSFAVTDYVKTVDLAAGRASTKQTRTAQFLFAGASVTQQDQRFDGDIAYNVGADGNARRAGDRDARDRRIDALQYPVTILRATLDPAAKVTNLRQEGDDDLVDIATAAGDTLTLAVHRATKLPSRVASKAAHPNLGDVTVTTTFADYSDAGGLKVPAKLTTTADAYPQLAIDVARTTFDVDTADLAASDVVRTASPPTPQPVEVTVEPVAKGIWWLAGSGNHRSIVFEFDDHLVLFEAPVSEARTKAVIDKARTLSAKPLTHAVVSHHHFDHSGGLRVAVAEGLTIVTHRTNDAFFKMLVARPFTIEPDALAKAPKPLNLELVDDMQTLKDGSMEVQLYHLLDNPREGTNLFAYVPRERLLVQADLYDSTWPKHPWGQNVLDNLAKRKLRIDRHVPVHGAREAFADMVRNITMKPSE